MLGVPAAGRCEASAGALDAAARTGCNDPFDCTACTDSFAERCMTNHAPAPMAIAPTRTAIGTRALRDDCGAACGGGVAGWAIAEAPRAEVASTTVASACTPAATPAPAAAIEAGVAKGEGPAAGRAGAKACA